jgi:hypothetical protein
MQVLEAGSAVSIEDDLKTVHKCLAQKVRGP